MMQRMACFEKIRDARDGAIVVATYTSAFEWRRVDPDPLNFVSVGAMGQASSHGLGLAIGLPEQKVVVLDGDGSLLMNMSTLTTIAKRLQHIPHMSARALLEQNVYRLSKATAAAQHHCGNPTAGLQLSSKLRADTVLRLPRWAP